VYVSVPDTLDIFFLCAKHALTFYPLTQRNTITTIITNTIAITITIITMVTILAGISWTPLCSLHVTSAGCSLQVDARLLSSMQKTILRRK
jgi:hypothetical protein